jgi:hypothetical protein
MIGPYPTALPLSSEALKVTMAAADASNGNSFPLTGSEKLLIQNTDSSAHTVTISSVAINGRTGDITTYSVGAGEIHAFDFHGGIAGWQQSDGTVHLAVSSALIYFGVLKPAN